MPNKSIENDLSYDYIYAYSADELFNHWLLGESAYLAGNPLLLYTDGKHLFIEHRIIGTTLKNGKKAGITHLTESEIYIVTPKMEEYLRLAQCYFDIALHPKAAMAIESFAQASYQRSQPPGGTW